MRITVELAESEINEIIRYAEERKKGPAIRKLALEALMLRKRRFMSERIMAGRLTVEIPRSIGKGEDRSRW
jgi:hypothetical protein